jgi:hypothetical protein
MKYVKLTARPNTWFKEGTEVFNYDSDYNDKKRITVQEWNDALGDYGRGGIAVRGLRVCELGYEMDLGYNVGDIREDGEWCRCDEFDVEYL